MTDIALLIIKNLNPDIKGFVIQPWRWVVERTNAWLVKSRRLSLDYELLFDTSESFIYISMIRKILRRIKSNYQSQAF